MKYYGIVNVYGKITEALYFKAISPIPSNKLPQLYNEVIVPK